ncbi:MAG: hypothetical protein WCA19_00140 [Candidatus Acidiferrales bacterium]
MNAFLTSDGKRIAVVAVHGVAYHEPGSSANAVSELLLGLPKGGGSPRYAPIQAETLHIPLHPLEIHKPLKPGELGLVQKKFEAIEERTSFLTREWRTSERIEETNTKVADDFMRLTLQDYRGANPKKPKDARDASAYNTTRLRTTRVGQGPGTVAGQSGGGNSADIPDAGSSGRGGPATKTGGAIDKPIHVDVYEMYWADLSRPKGTVLSFFQALYQLLFHFASLSRLAISTGYLENRNLWRWRALDRMQIYAVRMLTLPIPILNVILLATVFGAVPRLIPGIAGKGPAPGYTAIGAGLLGILIYLLLSRFLKARGRPLSWALQPLVIALLLAGAAHLIALRDNHNIVLSVEGLAVGSAILYFSVMSYDDVRDGAKESAVVLWVLWLLAIFFVWICRFADSVEEATLWTMQYVLAALRISWLLLFVFAFAALVLGAFAWRGIPEKTQKDRRARARAAVRTSRFALAMPTLGILIVTLALWSGLFVKTRGENGDYGNSLAVRLFGNTIKQPRDGGKWFSPFFLGDKGVIPYLDQSSATVAIITEPVDTSTSVTVSATIQVDSKEKQEKAQLVVNPQVPALSVSPGTVIGGNPSSVTVALDNSVPPGKVTVHLSTDQLKAYPQEKDLSFNQALAAPPLRAEVPSDNLTHRQPNEYFQGLLVWSATPGFPIALLLLLSVFFLLGLWVWPSIYTENADSVPVKSKNRPSRRMWEWLSRGLDSTKIATGLAWCAAFAVPSAFALFYGWGRLRSYFLIHTTASILEYMGLGVTSAAVLAGLAGSGSSILGIILDVDNYLRTSPPDETPRARIMERYVSLLDYLSDYKDPADGKSYDRIVIVAHSLGALISADLLRFLKVQSASPRIDVYLFTMGNPLRQLLNRFFPYLYEWVHSLPENSLGSLRSVAQPQQIPKIGGDELPDPSLLAVKRWLSAYRSGDYVGRALWLNEWYNRVDPAIADGGEVYVATEEPFGLREEMCIGAGAHQHYWDQSAPDIAEKLDELIWR